MQTVNIQEAEMNLSKLLEQVGRGNPFIITEAGRPIAKVVAVDAPETTTRRRLGFLAGEIEVPDDFDRIGESGIERLFGDDPGG